MKKTLLWLLALAVMLLTAGAAAEGALIIDGSDQTEVTAGEAFEISGVVELTPGEARVSESFAEYPVDERNQYIVIPMHVMNLGFDDISVAETLQMKLLYREYAFELYDLDKDAGEAEEAATDDGGITGTWHIYEYTTNGNSKDYDVTIRKADDGEGYTWSGTSLFASSMKFTWNPEKHVLTAGSGTGGNAIFIMDGAMGGGGSGYRLFGVRDGGSATGLSGDADLLGMLEEDDYSYVFRVPNVVVRNLAECTVQIGVGENEYTLRP